ncbi:MAG: (Fe-S)-binding protein [Acidobacteria bacterium]|nr:(Fe-S)-binding protein [Acidobacteriota bacterium]
MIMTQEAIRSGSDLTLDALYETAEGRQILSCIQCGICAGTCPYGEYMDYPPRRIIAMLRAGLIEEVFRSESLLRCVACYSCMAKCPRDIRLTEVLLPLVKEEVFANLPQVPAELQAALQNMLRHGNPQGVSPRKRADWAKTAGVFIRILPEDPRPVDVLWFVECYPAYHPRGQDNSRAVAKLFHALDVDFAILGNEERCAGECARLVGEAGLFDTLREKNVGIFRKYQFNQIVTAGAHAYDAFKWIYPGYGFDYPLEHTTTFFAKRLDALKPKLTQKLDYLVTYHDACCLGRHNGFYEEPRLLLRAIPGIKLVEMTHNRINSLCCGGGGGGMWLDTYYKRQGMERLSDRRVKEAIATGADVLAVACPYEVSRFEDSLKVMGYDHKMIVRDIVELLAESLGGD